MMFLLVLGIFLWGAAHLLKRLAPDVRASLPGRGLIAALIVLGLVLMVFGYRGAPYIDVWYPPAFFTHVNNVLMLFAFYSFGIGMSKGRHAQKIRHPQLTAVKIWAVAHLLVNGDLASIILFGSMLAWAVIEVVLINRSEPVWTKPDVIRPRGDLKNLAISLAAFVIVGGIHVALGYNPFG